MLKYPVLLVHGAGFRDKTLGFINYWGRIPKLFLKNGIKVYHGGTDAWGSIEKNAEILLSRINYRGMNILDFYMDIAKGLSERGL